MTASFGERLSAFIVAAVSRSARTPPPSSTRATSSSPTISSRTPTSSFRRPTAARAPTSRGCSARSKQRAADRHRLHRRHRRRPDDDHRAQRIGLQRGDRRRRGRRIGDRDLDRRRRRAERRSARRAGRVRAAADDLRRGDGAVVLRRQGAALGDDRAGRRQADSDPHQEHLQPRRAGHADLAQGRATMASWRRASPRSAIWRC